MARPGREHWQGVKRIFRYLRGTTDIGLVYGNGKECLVTGYSDSDYAADVDTRRSVTGYVFTLGGSVVSWKSTLQSSVTLSTTEAEYMALTSAAKESIWLKGLVGELGIAQDFATVYCDSLSAICLAKDQVHHDRTKHIDVRVCTLQVWIHLAELSLTGVFRWFIHKNENGYGGVKVVAELNQYKEAEKREVRGGVAGEGQGLSEEDELRIIDDGEDANSRRSVSSVQLPVVTHRSKSQVQGRVRWDKFLPVGNPKVLLVESDDSTRHVVTALLRNCSYEGEVLHSNLKGFWLNKF
uniref:Uncharacterized protein n=1 Tax=Chenopodium quinoa TaxID=63459 RepID=A0A803MVT2_CHEQI